MTKSSAIAIVSAIDEAFIQHLAVMFCSLLENNQALGKSIQFYLIHDGIAEQKLKKLKNFIEKYGQKIDFILVDPSQFTNFKITHHVSLATYYRLLIPALLPQSLEKVLYLDADMIIKQDIEDLWKADVTDYALAAVPDFTEKNRHEVLGLPIDKKYFNAGVMILNLSYWRSHQTSEELIQFIQEHPDKIKFWDQDALNACLHSKYLPLSAIWNQQTSLLERYGFKSKKSNNIPKEISTSIQNPGIIHYTSPSKPWHYMNKHPYKQEYYRYLALTPWKNYTPPDRTFSNMMRKHKIFPTFLEKFLSR